MKKDEPRRADEVWNPERQKAESERCGFRLQLVSGDMPNEESNGAPTSRKSMRRVGDALVQLEDGDDEPGVVELEFKVRRLRIVTACDPRWNTRCCASVSYERWAVHNFLLTRELEW